MSEYKPEIAAIKKFVLDFHSIIAIMVGKEAFDKYLDKVSDPFNVILRSTDDSLNALDAALVCYLDVSVDVLLEHPTENRLISGGIMSGLIGLACETKSYRLVPWRKLVSLAVAGGIDKDIMPEMLRNVIERYARQQQDDYYVLKEYFAWWKEEVGLEYFNTPTPRQFYGPDEHIPEAIGDILVAAADCIRWLLAEQDLSAPLYLEAMEKFKEKPEEFYRGIPLIVSSMVVRVLDMRKEKKYVFNGDNLALRVGDVIRLHARFFQDYLDVVEAPAYWMRLINDKPVGGITSVEFENVVRQNLGMPLAFVTKP